MELPFKYMVLAIFKKLNDRGLPLIINRISLIDYFTEFMKKSFFTLEEKKQIGDNLDFDYEIDELFNKYYKYIDITSEGIRFDKDYSKEIDDLIILEKEEYDKVFIHDIDFVIEGSTSFLEIIGVKIRKDLYNYLADIEKSIEECYSSLSDFENYNNLNNITIDEVMNKIKKYNMLKIIMLVNSKNLLSKYEYYDLIGYAHTVSDNEDRKEEIALLLESEDFDDIDIYADIFLRSIFLGSELYRANLKDRIVINMFPYDDNIKYSIIKFYLVFIKVLEKEIGVYNEIVDMELVKTKYRIINTMDSVYGTVLFMGSSNNIFEGVAFNERYNFVYDAVYYFSKEILMYDNEKYRNTNYDTDNTLIYLNNIMKKILIKTYYELTNDELLVSEIKNNPLYKVNTISSGFLSEIIDKPRNRIKEK